MTTSPRTCGATPPRSPAPLQGRLGPAVAYAFSDRGSGTMSASVGEGDHRANRDALARAVGLAGHEVAWMHQVHGADVAVADAPLDPPPACDGILTTTPGLGLGVLVADCVPVLLAARGAVAAAHAGRGGVLAGVVPATVHRLRQVAGASAPVDAVIGPAIGPCCYEVPADMARDVDVAVPGTAARTTWGTPSLDLVAGVAAQLAAVDVRRVTRAGGCTRCEGGARWFSHRATGGDGRPAGRQAGIVVMGVDTGGVAA